MSLPVVRKMAEDMLDHIKETTLPFKMILSEVTTKRGGWVISIDWVTFKEGVTESVTVKYKDDSALILKRFVHEATSETTISASLL